MALITNTELKTLRDVGSKIDIAKADEAIKLAETVDLYVILGNFYFDVVANAAGLSYTDLMDGSTFTVNGRPFIQSGIKALVADLAYARYVDMINTNFSPFGITVKSTQDSVPITEGKLKQIILQARRDADVKFGIIDLYLDQNKSTFPRYDVAEDDINCNPKIVNGAQNWSII